LRRTDQNYLGETIKEVNLTVFIIGFPRVWEKMQEKIAQTTAYGTTTLLLFFQNSFLVLV
jgi:long-subunit acyl-CoA synthetase (AMP-forming)